MGRLAGIDVRTPAGRFKAIEVACNFKIRFEWVQRVGVTYTLVFSRPSPI
jgi:hypothetical protein